MCSIDVCFFHQKLAKARLEEERVYSHPGNSLLLKDDRAETKSETGQLGAYRLLFFKTQAHLPKESTAHSGLVPPIPISNQENAL